MWLEGDADAALRARDRVGLAGPDMAPRIPAPCERAAPRSARRVGSRSKAPDLCRRQRPDIAGRLVAQADRADPHPHEAPDRCADLREHPAELALPALVDGHADPDEP